MPSRTKNIPKESPLHRKLVKMLDSRLKIAHRGQETKHEAWSKAENSVLAYIPESELDAKRRTSREDRGEPRYTTIQLPYTYALLMAAHTYLTSVFFGRNPVHQFSGRHGEGEQQIQMLEALVAYQVDVGRFLGPYFVWMYDTLKYGVGVVEEYWENQFIQYATIEEVPDPNDPLGERLIKQQTRVKLPGYQGNKVCNISPWDFYPDPRVPVSRFQEGEFCAVRKRMSWETIIRRKAQGYYMNTEHIRGGESQGNQSVIPSQQSNSQLERPEDLTFIIGEDNEKHPAIVTCFEVHVSLIPDEWGVGDSNFPEKWVFTITDDLRLVIGAQPHGAMHGEFPFAALESEVEGYGVWNRGLPEIVEPIQNTMDWLINTHFFNVRAAMNNQFILDPSMVVASDAEEAGAGFIWRLRPEAYGKDIRSFVHQIPVQDFTRGHIADMQLMQNIGEKMTGINDQIMGALGGTGRKTATEVRTSTGFGVNRLKTLAEYASATGFSSHAQRLVQMSQQYYTAERKLRVVGDLAQEAGMDAERAFLDVTQDKIQGFYDFVPVDGTLPVDRLAQAALWKDLMMNMRQVPSLLQQYDLGRIFAWVASLSGVRNVNRFKIQVGTPGALMQQAEAGNLVAMPGPGARRPPQGVSQSAKLPSIASPISA
jgi:hypothetical protein